MSKDKRTIDIAQEMLNELPINLKNINVKNIMFLKWLDRLRFFHIFFVWTGTIFLFGLMYNFFQTDSTYLLYNIKNVKVTDISDAVYFSFITATSTGYGDIIPIGLFKIVAIGEVVFGLLLLAVVTSKLISLKQDVILSEIYEISFHERINEIRSSLLVFRQNITRLIYRIEEKKIKKRELKEIYSYMIPLEIALSEISLIIGKKEKSHYTKNIDSLNAEIIFTSVLHSIEKVAELVATLNEYHHDWKKEIINIELKKCISLNDDLFQKAFNSKVLPKKTIQNMMEEQNRIVDVLRKEIEKN